MAIQRAFAAHNLNSEVQPIKVRVGLSAGEPVADHIDLFGTTVNLAAQVCAFAQPGQTLISNVTRGLSLGKPFVFYDIGEVDLKGLPAPSASIEVRWREQTCASTGTGDSTAPAA